MKLTLIIAVVFSLGLALSDDITVGDLSARLDSLEKKVEGQSSSGEELPSVEEFETLKKNLKILTGRLEELEHVVYGKLGISAAHETQTIAVSPSIIPPGKKEQNQQENEEEQTTFLPDEEATLKLMKKKEEKPSKALSPKKNIEKTRADKTKEAEKNSPSLQSGSPLAQYNTAMALYDKREYDKSQKAFAEFIKNNPKDALVHQAYYWQGNCLINTNQIPKAKLSFVQSYQKNKTGPKAAEALFELGNTLLKDKKRDQACTAWKKLQVDYPKMSPELQKKLQEAKTKNKC